MSPSRDFGKVINERRLALGYSLGQLANRMGTTATKVRSWERGDAVPDDQMLTQLADELNMSSDVLRATLPPPEPDEADGAVPLAVFSDAAHTSVGEVDGDDMAAVESGGSDEAAEPTATVAAIAEHDGGGDDEEEATSESAVEADEGEDHAASDGADEDQQSDIQVAGDGVADREGEDADDELRLADLPTEAVPVLPVPQQPEPAVGAVAAPAMVRTVPAPPRVDPNDLGVPEPSGLLAPVERFMAKVFDPDRNYLFWIRIVLIILVFFVFLRVLAWAVPEFFDALKDILDTIESTPSEGVPGPELLESS